MATWQSFLCQAGWAYSHLEGNWILFNEDGTGQLHCGSAPAAFICAELAWKPVDHTSTTILQQILNQDNPEAEATVDIEIALSLRRPGRGFETTWEKINELSLSSAATRPKTYTLHMARGTFPDDRLFYFNDPHGAGEHRALEVKGYYSRRIVFNISPYPPFDEWLQEDTPANRASRSYKFWEFKEFHQDYQGSEPRVIS